jgi:hypothetical protein
MKNLVTPLAAGTVIGQKAVWDGTNWTAFENYLSDVAGAFYAVQSATFVHYGRGGTWKLTPTLTGRVRLILTGAAALSVAGLVVLGGRYGTGTAPIQGAAVTGTAWGQIEYQGGIISGAAGTASLYSGFAVMDVITGLTLNTAYWFDLILKSMAVGNIVVRAAQFFVEEF